MPLNTLKKSPEPLKAKASKKITILGSTGTIGQNTINLIENDRNNFQIVALTARSNVKLLAEQARLVQPEIVVIENEDYYAELKALLEGTGIEVATGAASVIEAAEENSDMVISGIVGAAALPPTLAAIRKGRNIGLANKECLVCAGELVMQEARKYGAAIIPIDSEHNAIFQSFDFENPETIEKITLTASGGPFRSFTKEMMKTVSMEQAVAHPNWNMGAKISVDSATMMNKGLEVIEAFHLFPVSEEQIEVLVHPESIIHCLVSYKDGSVLAGLSTPDMKVPISYALGWPERIKTNTSRLDLVKIGRLTFEAPDEEKFPALKLARQALKDAGTAPTILNAANEIAVENFIAKKIGFLEIVDIVEHTLGKISPVPISSIEQVTEIDKKARETATNIIKNRK